MNYRLPHRDHIDGLRAIAVLGVVLIHFKAEWLPGGFLGVDVFFVISGYLISKTLYHDVSSGTFSLTQFYEKRARRIIPALVAVTAATAAAAYIILLPQELVKFANSVLASALFGTNILFYATSDYFAPAANEIPLLHYWSLAVEEQFYVFFPLLVLITRNWPRRRFLFLLLVLSVASLAGAQWMLGRDPAAAFYLLPFRVFELGIGCLLALPSVGFPRNSMLGGGAVFVGVALIVGGMVFVTEKCPFPGAVALIPCIGAGLVIWGADAVSTAPSRFLGSALFRFVGKISYSLYLVHWPVVVFGLRLFPHADQTAFLLIGTLVSVALGYLSFALVETPTRQRRVLSSRGAIFTASGAALAVFVGASISVVQAQGFPNWAGARVNRMLAYLSYDPIPAFRGRVCFLTAEQRPTEFDTATCVPSGARSILLWGDSYLAQYYFGLLGPVTAHGYLLGQLTASGCAPTPGIAGRPNCDGFNDIAIEAIIKAKPGLVVLGAAWTATDEQLSALDRTINRLNEAGITIAVLGPSPIYKRPVPSIAAERMLQGNASNLSGADLETALVYGKDARMQGHFAARSDVQYISVLETVCPNRECPLTVDGAPAHFDMVHLTREGSRYYGERLAPSLIRLEGLLGAGN